MVMQCRWIIGRCLCLLLVSTVATAAFAESPRGALNRIIEHSMMAPEPSYGEQVAVCEQIAAGRSGPVLDGERLSSLAVNRRQVVKALGYLHARNQLLCERAARQQGTLKREVIRQLQARRGKAGRSYYPTHDRFLDEGYRYHRLASEYLGLPLGLRRHLESRIGHEPFDLKRALDDAGVSG
mgnify:FL=1